MAYTDIDKPSDYFNTVTYSGNSSNNRTISGFGFNPDWVWVKCRTSAFSHTVADIVRGTNANMFINETGAEINPTTDIGRGGIGQVTTDGFIAVQGTSSMDNTNTSGQNYVGWSWLAGGTGSSNTVGDISSSVSANTTSGFSIVSYTGSGSNATVGHGLSSAPAMVIIRSRDDVNNWRVGHNGLTDWSYRINMESGGAEGVQADVFNSTAPTSSVFSVGTSGSTNGSGKAYISYCFAEKKGFSKFGSYTGNGSTDGTFIYTGFKPAWIMCKCTSTTRNWNLRDNKINPFNVTEAFLEANGSVAEQTDPGFSSIDILSNGFKHRGVGGDTNVSGAPYIYMCFAENPFVTSTGIPTTAR